MTNEKSPSSYDGTAHSRARPDRRVTGIAGSQRGREADLITLEIDEDFDSGGDPYNRTGSHCIVKLRDEA